MQNKVSSIDVLNWEHLISIFLGHEKEGNTYFYRGQGDSRWKLECSFDRGNSLKSAVALEAEYQIFWKRFIEEFEFRKGSTHGESSDALEALAQHYDLRTRLLDWTTAPLVATFFAIQGLFKHSHRDSAVIYSFNWSSLQASSTSSGLCLIREAAVSNDRIRTQHGCLIRNKTDFTAFEDYINSLPIGVNVLTRLVVGRNIAVEILRLLKILKINNESIFGDFSGLCRDLNLSIS